MLRALRLAVLLALGLARTAHAGEQYVDATGFAVSGYDVTSYFALTQSPLGMPQPEPQPGRAGITARWNGATFAFATAENRALFLTDPARFVPRYDGHCAYGVARGSKVPGNPRLWRIVDGTLYLNITRDIAGFWEADIPGNLARSESLWGGLDADRASPAAIPDFTSPAPTAP